MITIIIITIIIIIIIIRGDVVSLTSLGKVYLIQVSSDLGPVAVLILNLN